MNKEVQVGDKVVSLVDWIDTKVGNVYTVERHSEDMNGVWLEETNNFLTYKEFKLIENVDNMNKDLQVGDYIKVDVGAFETFGQGTRIEEVEIIEVDKSDNDCPYRVKDRRSKKFWIHTDYIVEDENKITSEPMDTGLIDKQEHYTANGIQPIELMRQNFTPEAFQGFLEGNIIKYVLRHRRKNGVEDLRKAMTYLTWLIDEEENE